MQESPPEWVFKNNVVLTHRSGLAFIKRINQPVQMDEAMALIHRSKLTARGLTLIEAKSIQAKLFAQSIAIFESMDQGQASD